MAFGTFSFNLGNYPYLCLPKFTYMCNIIGKYYIVKATGTGYVVRKLYIKIFSIQVYMFFFVILFLKPIDISAYQSQVYYYTEIITIIIITV